MQSDNGRKPSTKKNSYPQHERVINMLPEHNRDYILEELAVLMGCVPKGLGFEAVKEVVKKPQPLFIVYPGEEEGAFTEAKKQLASSGQKVFDVQWMEIVLRTLREEGQQDLQNDPNNNNTEIKQINNERLKPPYYAHFAKESAIKTLLTQERKCLLFLISIGRDYHQGERLAAMVDLFRNVIKECAELAQQQSHAPNANSKSNRVKGPWRILIVKADTLQAYNEGNTPEAIEKYREISKKWEEEVSVLFQQLIDAGDQIVPVELEFISWEPFLKRAKESYHFEAFYKELSEIYLYSSAHALTKGIDKKGWAFIERQKQPRGDKKSKEALPLPDPSKWLLGLSQSKQEQDEEFITKQRHLVKSYSYEYKPELRSVGLHEINDNYAVERTEILEELKDIFSSKDSSSDNNNGCPIVALHGMSAAGKSYLACYYANHASQYTYQIWLKADTKNNLQADYKAFGQDQGIVDGNAKSEEILAEVKQWLENLGSERRWLLIFDDVNDYEMVKRYIPAKGGDVIITSQKNDWGIDDNIHGIAVDVMTPEQALALLQNVSGRKTAQEKDALNKLAKRLGYLPLALEQAGAYLQQYPDTSIEAYIEEYKLNCAKLMSSRYQLVDGLASQTKRKAKAAVAATFHMSLERMNSESKEFARLAKDMINACAYLASDNIPIELLTNWLKQTHPEVVDQGIYTPHMIVERLAEHSLIKYNKATGVIGIHAVMQDILRRSPAIEYPPSTQKTIAPVEQLQALAQALIATEEAMDIYSAEVWGQSKRLMPQLETFLNHYLDSDNIKMRLKLKCILAALQNRLGFYTTNLKDIMSLIEENFKDEPLEIARAKHVLGQAYNALGDSQQAQNLYTEALAIRRDHYPIDQNKIANTLISLASIHQTLGEYQKAESLLKEALAIKKTLYPERHVAIARVIGSLASLYHSTGNYQLSVSLYEEALSIQEFNNPSGDISIANAKDSLANIKRILGDYEGAKILLEEALAIKKAFYPEGHVSIAGTLVNLGAEYYSLGNYQQAKDLLEEALAIEKAHYPKGHVQIASTLRNLAPVYKAMGDYQKAKPLLEEALAIQKACYPEGHIVMANTIGHLANMYQSLGDYQKAKGLLKETLSIEKAHYPKGHVMIADILASLASTYTSLGNYQKAKALLKEALAIKEAHYPKGHVAIAGTQQSLATACQALGDYQKAKELLEEALAIKEAHYPKGHVAIAGTQQSLATACQALGDYQKAKELLEEALAIKEAHYPKGHVAIAGTQQSLATACQALGDYQKAKELLEEALAIKEAHYPKGHVAIAGTQQSLATACQALGDYQKAKELLEEALAIKEAHYPKGHVAIAGTQQSLATACQALGDYQKAKELLEEALAIKEAHYPKGHVEIAGTQQSLANAYKALGDYQKAKELLEEALATKKAHYPKGHVEIAGTQYVLATVYQSLGDNSQAKILLEEVLAIEKAHYPVGHKQIVLTQRTLLSVCMSLGDYQAANLLMIEIYLSSLLSQRNEKLSQFIESQELPNVEQVATELSNVNLDDRPKHDTSNEETSLTEDMQPNVATANFSHSPTRQWPGLANQNYSFFAQRRQNPGSVLDEQQEEINAAEQISEAEADTREEQTHDASTSPEQQNNRYMP